MFTDWYLRRRHRVDGFLFDRRHNPWAGWISMLVAGAVSILLFSNQQQFVGYVRDPNERLAARRHRVRGRLRAGRRPVLRSFFRLQRDRTDEALVVPD